MSTQELTNLVLFFSCLWFGDVQGISPFVVQEQLLKNVSCIFARSVDVVFITAPEHQVCRCWRGWGCLLKPGATYSHLH